ncbi:MAG: hypothetical protein IKZ09_06885 [Clostridia bacterium]|nr:hypothetical protein [Clostridia bacterium]
MKKTELTRTLALLLLGASLTAAVGCGDAASTDTAVTEARGETAAVTEAVTENIYAHDLGSYDFGGETFTMYTRDIAHLHSSMHADVADGTTLNDAIYERNVRLMDQYNFKFAEVLEENDTKQARVAVMAGEDTYDMITTRCVYAFSYAMEGLLRPVSDMPEINMSKPYWDKELTDAMSIGNVPFFAVGAFNTSGYEYTHLLAFNKELAANFDFDLYGKVKDGSWTFGAMNEMMMAAVSDINGDGKMNAEDRYGLLSTAKQILPCFWIAAGQQSMKMDANDYPTYSMLSDEVFQTIFVEIIDLAHSNNVWYKTSYDENVHPDQVTMFIDGLSLFIDMPVFYLETLRTMDTDFGLVPYPKYDEAQEQYYSRIEGCEQTCIPVTNVKHLEMTGVILEAMASDSAQHLVPAYYETLLKSKLSRDNDSEEMLEIVFGSRIFDWGDTVYCPELRDGPIRDMMKKGTRDIASTAAKLEKTMAKKLADAIAAFEELNH